MADRRCLLVSCHGADRRPWNGVPYEFLSAIAAVEDAAILAPPGRPSLCNAEPTDETLFEEVRLRLVRRAARKIAGRYTPLMQRTRLEGTYDLTVFVCQFLEEVQEIDQIDGWREKSGNAVIFLLESWTSTFPDHAAEMAVLSRFDHVFLLNGSAVSRMQGLVSTPVSALATACDVLLATPAPFFPPRAIDLICFGRWDQADHETLVRHSREAGLFYYYDVWLGMRAPDWGAVRRRNAELIQRSRYYLVWKPAAWHQKWRDGKGQDQALSTRYFEGAAGGAVLLGTRPDCPEFDACFDWPDALVEIGPDPAATIRALEDDPARVARIRQANITNSLRRHDWAHRWAEMLTTLGLPLTQAHRLRLARLDLLAAQLEPMAARGGLHVIIGGTA